MSDYIYTSDGQLCSVDELMHYGVPGMKWGRRKIRAVTTKIKTARTKKADHNIRKNVLGKKLTDDIYKYQKKELDIKYGNKPKKAKKLSKKQKKLDRVYENDKAVFDYKIAKNKAYKDRKYKKTDAYKNDVKRGKAVLRKRRWQEALVGYSWS